MPSQLFNRLVCPMDPTSLYLWEYLNDWSQEANWIANYFEIAKIGLSPSQYLQWKIWRSDMTKGKL